MTTTDDLELLTRAHVARILRVSRATVQSMIDAGTLPSIPHPESGRPLLSVAAIREFQNERARITARGAA